MSINLNKEIPGLFLNTESVSKIIQYHSKETIFLAALDCNWVEQNSTCQSYFNLWAAVNFYEDNDRIFLHGARFSTWNIEYELAFVKKVGNIGLFQLSLNNADEFPNEFVIRLERESGEHFYDNNDYRNYHVGNNQGHFSTAISCNKGIYSFGSIIPIKVI